MAHIETITVGADDEVLADARRTGRAEIVPTLIPLLRNPAGDGSLPDDDIVPDCLPGDAMAPARGLALALVLCTPAWFGIGVLLYTLYQ